MKKKQPLRHLSHLNESGEARMVDVGEKNITARYAKASGIVRMKPETLKLLRSGKIKKGDAFTVAKIAGILAVKKTPQLIPLCHPMPLDQIQIDFRDLPSKNGVEIEVRVKTTSKTGVEIEALNGVLITALTIYDMAKSYDPGMTITNVRLIEKTGGKSDYAL